MPIGDAEGNALAGVQTLRYYAGWTDKFTGDTAQAPAQGFLNYTRKVPIGVVGHIVPWFGSPGAHCRAGLACVRARVRRRVLM